MSSSVYYNVIAPGYPSATFLAERIADLPKEVIESKIPMKAASRAAAEDIREQFASGGRGTWAQLQPGSYKRGSKSPLIRTGKLAKVAGQYNAWTVTKTTASYSLPASVSYGMYHQTGYRNGKKRVPARPIKFNQELAAAAYDKWLANRIKAV